MARIRHPAEAAPVTPSGGARAGIRVKIVDLFIGNILNAVDAKGRASLPSTYRNVVERRQQRMAPPDGQQPEKLQAPEKLVTFMPHPRRTCLMGFDAAYAQVLLTDLRKGAKDAEGGELAALQDAEMAAFSDMMPVSYDPGGRMVLPPYLRDCAGITDLAYFVSGAEIFEVWDPETFRRERPELTGAQRQLTAFLAERAAK